MDPSITIFLLITLGLTVGTCVGIVGMGAGIALVPSLITFFGMSTKSAVGITLAMQTIPVGILGAYEYYIDGHLDLLDATLVASGMVLGIGMGSLIANRDLIPVSVVKKAIGIIAVISGIYIIIS